MLLKVSIKQKEENDEGRCNIHLLNIVVAGVITQPDVINVLRLGKPSAAGLLTFKNFFNQLRLGLQTYLAYSLGRCKKR